MTTEELRNKIIDILNDQKVRIEGDERDEYFNYGVDTCVGYIEDILKNTMHQKMIVNDKKIQLLIEMIDSGEYCDYVYFNWFGKRCLECNEKCKFYNAENMMKWLKEDE